MRLRWLPFIAAIVLAPAAGLAQRDAQATPMEIQALQTREYETTKETLFAAVVSVFQDLGYQLDNADLASGFINASSATGRRTNLGNMLLGQRASGNTRATAFIEQMPGGRARVRINFLNTRSTSSMYGQSHRRDRPVLDPATYNAAWERIDEAIFVRTAIAGPSQQPHPSTAAQPATTTSNPQPEPGATPR